MAELSFDTPVVPAKRSLQCGERLLDLSRCRVMGVLNITPDSFSDGGALHQNGRPCMDKALLCAEQMLHQGADIIDIGGESTRPGAQPVSVQEEMDRVMPVVAAIGERFDTVVSVDSSSPELMLAAVAAGAGMLNDVRALQRDGAVKAAVKTGLPVCLMHMQGQPKTMQQSPRYHSVIDDVLHFLQQRVECCTRAGVESSKILLDPGFGFGKRAEHNLVLLNRLPELLALGFPVVAGLSRKSLIGQVLGREVGQRLAGSLALAVLAAERGASIVRVHDVAETVDAVKLCMAVTKEQF